MTTPARSERATRVFTAVLAQIAALDATIDALDAIVDDTANPDDDLNLFDAARSDARSARDSLSEALREVDFDAL